MTTKLKPTPYINLDELRKLPPVAMLNNTHFVARGLNVVFGPSGTYKSFYVLGQALAIAQSTSVVYVAAEGSSGLAARVDSWLGHNKIQSVNVYFTCQEINLLDKDAVDSLISTYYKIKPAIGLVIFDTYARCLVGGDENSARDAGLAVNSCARIQRLLKCAVVLVHHANRAETGERGSGALRGGADSMIEVQSTDQNIRIECSKMKDREPWPAESFRFQPYGDSGLLLPADQVPSTSALSNQEFKILEALTWSVFETSGATHKQLTEATKIGGSSVYRVLSQLKTNSQIHQDKKGDPYSISQSGMTALNFELSKRQTPVNSSNTTGVNAQLSNSQVTIN